MLKSNFKKRKLGAKKKKVEEEQRRKEKEKLEIEQQKFLLRIEKEKQLASLEQVKAQAEITKTERDILLGKVIFASDIKGGNLLNYLFLALFFFILNLLLI